MHEPQQQQLNIEEELNTHHEPMKQQSLVVGFFFKFFFTFVWFVVWRKFQYDYLLHYVIRHISIHVSMSGGPYQPLLLPVRKQFEIEHCFCCCCCAWNIIYANTDSQHSTALVRVHTHTHTRQYLKCLYGRFDAIDSDWSIYISFLYVQRDVITCFLLSFVCCVFREHNWICIIIFCFVYLLFVIFIYERTNSCVW